jgi:hypothetical protein
MGRVWQTLLEVACFVEAGIAENYAVLCLLAANGN